MYVFLDVFFVIFHGAIVVFNVTGWIWRRTRRLHLLVISLTFLSWFGLGIFFGWGYCPSTDWHWDVKRQLGETDLPASYVKYYADALTGTSWDPLLVNTVVIVVALAALIASVVLNRRDRRRR